MLKRSYVFSTAVVFFACQSSWADELLPKGKVPDPEDYRSQVAPDAISHTEGDSQNQFFFLYLSDVDVDKANHGGEYYYGIQNKSTRSLLTVSWDSVGLFGRRITPGRSVRNLYTLLTPHRVTDTVIRFDEALSEERTTKAYLEAQTDANNPKEGIAESVKYGKENVQTLTSTLSINSDEGAYSFEFSFTSTLFKTANEVKYEAWLDQASMPGSLVFSIEHLPIPKDERVIQMFPLHSEKIAKDVVFEVLAKEKVQAVFDVDGPEPKVEAVKIGIFEKATGNLLVSGRAAVHLIAAAQADNPFARIVNKVKEAGADEATVEKVEALAKEYGPKFAEARKGLGDVQKRIAEARKAATANGLKGEELEAAINAAVQLTDEQKAALKETRQLQQKFEAAVVALLSPDQAKAVGVRVGKKQKAE